MFKYTSLIILIRGIHMYLQAVKRPFSNKKRLIWGAVLLFFPIINFFFFGYLYECARRSYAGKNELPRWQNYGHLFLTGLKMFLISLIYAIPVYFLLALASTFYLAIDDLLGFPLYLICILIMYLLPIALINFTMYGKFSFAFKHIIKRAFTWLYLKTLLKLILLLIPYLLFNFVVGFLIFSVLASVDWLMYLMSVSVLSIVSAAYQITSFTILAKIYRKL